jgi:hypothetical protein
MTLDDVARGIESYALVGTARAKRGLADAL